MDSSQENVPDIEELGVSHLSTTDIYRDCDQETTHKFVQDLLGMIIKGEVYDKKTWKSAMISLSKIHHIRPGTVQMNYAYYFLISEGKIKPIQHFQDLARAKTVRSNSGVIVVTVLTSPYPHGQKFSCRFNCYYCPDYPDMPRSYIPDEPAVKRGERNGWDAVNQVWDRLSALYLNGHPIDKLEVLVLGGTWDSYPVSYQEEFCRDVYYAANTFFENKDTRRMERLSLKDEIRINQTAKVRVIGLTLETRPDQINSESVLRYRNYGCTRVQLGVQHTDDKILKKINRECYRAETIRAIWILKNNCIKVDIHLMPDLPGSSPEIDRAMFNEVLESEHFQADQWKIYPCETTPYTVIQKWMESGKYVHYSDEELRELIMEVMHKTHPWIRLNRVIRDIPSTHILDGNPVPNLRQILEQEMKKRGWDCNDIRASEVGSDPDGLAQAKDAKIFVDEYEASEGKEFFIAFRSPDRKYLYGFCRLRLSKDAGYSKDIPCPKDRKGELRHAKEELVLAQSVLKDRAMIRELHVYGKITPVSTDKKEGAQHYGFGRRLMLKAEEIAKANGYQKIAVISGVGVREYYSKKLGYHLEDTYMVKDLDFDDESSGVIWFIIPFLLVFLLFLFEFISRQCYLKY